MMMRPGKMIREYIRGKNPLLAPNSCLATPGMSQQTREIPKRRTARQQLAAESDLDTET